MAMMDASNCHCPLLLILGLNILMIANSQDHHHYQGNNLDRLRNTIMGRGRHSSRRMPADVEESFWSPTSPFERAGKEHKEDLRDRFNLGSTDPLSDDEQLAMFKDVLKNGLDPFDALTAAVNSKPMKAVLDHTEMQHRILEYYPILAAFDGFKQITGRRLNSEETQAGFVEGIKNMLVFFKQAMSKLKDPEATGQAMVKLAKSTDPKIQELFTRARGGDKMAVDEIGDLVKLDLFPGVDPQVLRQVASTMGNKQLLNMPDIMRFIDEDPYMSHFIRNPPVISAI